MWSAQGLMWNRFRTALVLLFIVAIVLLVHSAFVTQHVANTQNVQLTFYATDNLGYLEFLDLSNQTGDMILTNGQTILLNATQSYIILFVPYQANTTFESWSVQGDAVLKPGNYMTNVTVYANTTIVAIVSNPAVPVPEFPAGPMVMLLAFAVVIGLLHGRKIPASSKTRGLTSQGLPCIR